MLSLIKTTVANVVLFSRRLGKFSMGKFNGEYNAVNHKSKVLDIAG